MIIEEIDDKTVIFAGLTWNVKSGIGGPGPNNWSGSSNSVWVDSEGQLHLKIRKIGSIWYCSELSSLQSLSYGEYRFYIASNLENYIKILLLVYLLMKLILKKSILNSRNGVTPQIIMVGLRFNPQIALIR